MYAKNIKISKIRNTNIDGQTIKAAIENVKDGLVSKTEGLILVKPTKNGEFEIADGFHRIAQKIIDGKKEIRAEILFCS